MTARREEYRREGHVEAFDALAASLRSVGPVPMVFCPSPGNWGDSIINAGTRRFFEHYGFDYLEVKRSELVRMSDLRGAHVVLGGGGGWCDFWHTTPELTETLVSRVGHLTVLPTTFDEVPSEPAPRENLTLFARDRFDSLRHRPDASFCHDMAFHYRLSRLDVDVSRPHLRAMRTDKESRIDPEVTLADPANRDVSMEGKGLDDPRGLYELLATFGSVRTDRLHVAIAAAQLGLDVTLSASGYSKIEGVYRSSIESTFQRVEFVKDAQ